MCGDRLAEWICSNISQQLSEVFFFFLNYSRFDSQRAHVVFKSEYKGFSALATIEKIRAVCSPDAQEGHVYSIKHAASFMDGCARHNAVRVPAKAISALSEGRMEGRRSLVIQKRCWQGNSFSHQTCTPILRLSFKFPTAVS